MGRAATSVKTKVTAKRPVAAKSANKKTAPPARKSDKRLAAALAQQKATNEILRVMSASPSDVQPVLDAVARHAARMCDAPYARVLLIDGDGLGQRAEYSTKGRRVALPARPVRVRRTAIIGRAVLDRKTIHVTDIVPLLDREYPDARENALAAGFRTILAVPLMREGRAYGGVLVYRRVVRRFTRDQVALVETFARQAAIAIDNVRLFHETREALEQQTATSEILSVISSSPTDVQPVFETIAANALRLCGATFSTCCSFDGELIHLAAFHHLNPEGISAFREVYPSPPSRGGITQRAILTGSVVHVADVLADPEYIYGGTAKAADYRSVLAVPMLHGGRPIGAVTVFGDVARPFPKDQVKLLKTFASQAVIAIENARLFNETKDALDQQTATAQILQVISSSPGDLQPVLDTLVRAAAQFCGAPNVLILRRDDDVLRGAAGVGPYADSLVERMGRLAAIEIPLTTGSVSGRAALERRSVHIHDLAAASDEEFPVGRELQRQWGHRTVVATPLLREGVALGVIGLFRTEVKPFSDKQLQLLRIFADQAVIAIENVRLFTELEARNSALSEALEQQTATGEILHVISSSPTDAQPVFDAIVQSGTRLCDAAFAAAFRYDGDAMTFVAHHNMAPAEVELMHGLYPRPAQSNTATGRAVVQRQVIHIPDIREDSEYGLQPLQQTLGFRTVLAVPMLRNNEAIGALALWRREVDPFTDKQIELIKVFANQAVIAIENVRLFTELEARNRDITEALEQQTATSDILRVISGSPTDVQPVFDIIGERAEKLCDAEISVVSRLNGELIEVAALHGMAPKGKDAIRAQFPMRLNAETVTARTVQGRAVVHVPDVLADPLYETKGAALAAHYRCCLGVPMLREGQVIGAIFVARAKPGLFADSQIALLQTFADQAVIAIENVRLFTELQARNGDLTEALEQQTATSEILRVISQSPTDVQPVFDTIAAAALELCRASSAVVTRLDGEMLRVAALANVSPAGADAVRNRYPRPPGRYNAASRAVLTRSIVAIPDVLEDPEYEIKAPLLTADFRSVVAIPLMREGNPMGAITVVRPEAGPFPEKQIALLQTFADQAVIAIENVRLFKELEQRNAALAESLEQQTATSDILRVISQSRTNVQPVFDTIAAEAMKLCRASSGTVVTFDGALIHAGAVVTLDAAGAAAVRNLFPRPPSRDITASRAILTRGVAMIPDVLEDPDYASKPDAVAGGFRSALAVPLLHEGAPIGAVTVGRPEPGPFSDNEIALLRTFADQAVIAIENVRLFTELQARNSALAESLERQTATSEILRVISKSQTDVQPVFETIAAAVLKLCQATSANVLTFDGELLHVAALANVNPNSEASFRQFYPRPPGRDTAVTRAVLTKRVVAIPDVLDDPDYVMGDISLAAGFRSVLGIPLMREGRPIGAIAVGRPEPGPYADAQVELVKTFADQAVIAIENVRLFTELEARNRDITEALEQQTATSEILRVISRSQTDVQPVFDTIVRSAVRLSDGLFGSVNMFDGKMVHRPVAYHHYTPEAQTAAERMYPMRPSRQQMTGRAILSRAVAHVADVLTDSEYAPEIALAGGWRSAVAVPMLREGHPIGTILVTRAQPGLFSDRQIALLQTFADQAVIAIENVRLFTELEARTKQLTRSVGELKALGEVGQAVSSTLDLETVLSTIVTRATQLAGMDAGAIYEYNEERGEFFLHTADRFSDDLVEALRAAPIRKGEGALGRLAVTREPVQIHDIADAGVYKSRVRKILLGLGHRSLLAVPLLREDRLLGGLTVNRKTPGEFAPEVVALLQTFAAQSALAIQNARLFREIEEKSRELETASRHKSEFLANMSHELRTPLNAIIGFSEVLSEKLFGEVNAKQEEYIVDILESGRHLLSLINDILDLSKIEAGRMELETVDFQLPSAIDNAVTLVRERAERHGIKMERTLDPRLGTVRADERKVKQVLLNLLSNALKFTPEGGRIGVSAHARDGMAEISVTDTGVGIAPEDQEAVFEEFKQVGSSAKKREGTGLGLAISRKFIELHGGRIWLKSEVGAGSTFTFSLPLPSDQHHSPH